MNIREIAISRIKEYENNPRNNDLAVEKVKHSIERFGFLFPVIVDANLVIVAGHTRVRACRELGVQAVPCIIADELTEEQINLFRLVDNKTHEYSDWDFEKLKSELAVVDLTLEKNQILLDQFELSTEVFDIEPELAKIHIPTYNFLSSEKPKKPRVSTIEAANESDEQNLADEITEDYENHTEESLHETQDGISENSGIESAGNKITTEDGEVRVIRTPVANQFRFGDTAFFISQIELNRMNNKYADYIDSGEMLKRSFVDYLLEGVERK